VTRHRHPVNQQIHDHATRAQRAVDRFVAFFGSLRFLTWMTAFIACWILLNSAAWALRWDPYPWILLNLIFSTQASYAAPLILLSQNRSAERDRLKAEHDYGVNEAALTEIRATRELAREVLDVAGEVHRLLVRQQLSDPKGET
jgi:uncharacterized membrane protein